MHRECIYSENEIALFRALGEAIKIGSSIFSLLLNHEIEHRSVISEFFDQTDLTSLIGEL